jgi:hypothetical protein
MRSLKQRKTSTQNSPIAQNRKLTANIFSFQGPDSKCNQIRSPKPVTLKPFRHFPLLSVFPASTVSKEDIAKDARKNTQSFNTNITDDYQDKSEAEIKDNLVTGNAISFVPYRPLPTYPPEVFVNSDAVEFGFVPINELSQTNPRPISQFTSSAPIQNFPVLVIKSTLQLVLNDIQPKTQIQNYSFDNKSNETALKLAIDAQLGSDKELESSSTAMNPRINPH